MHISDAMFYFQTTTDTPSVTQGDGSIVSATGFKSDRSADIFIARHKV